MANIIVNDIWVIFKWEDNKNDFLHPFLEYPKEKTN